MTTGGRIDCESAYKKVLGAYQSLGFDAAVIGQWCIPPQDASDLLAHVFEQRPRKVLEVGTYVGVSTLMIAQALGENATVVTIDPNLPLAVEMASMNSNLGGLDGSVRAQDTARAAARLLGIEQRIHFIEGGFAVADTFAARRRGDVSRVTAVGPEVCETFGPFDLVFIDGLHFADAVDADLTLAARALAARGVVLMHDCIGIWGTNVRAGILRFLARQPEFRLLHPPYARLYHSIGRVYRWEEHLELAKTFRRNEPAGPHVEAFTRSLVASMHVRLRPSSVIEFAVFEPRVSAPFRGLGVNVTTLMIDPGATGHAFAALLEKAWGLVPSPDQSRDDLLLVGIGCLDHLTDEQSSELFCWMGKARAGAVFALTPLGEEGVAGPSSRPLAQLVASARSAGLSVREFGHFDLDPGRFAFAVDGSEHIGSSYACIVVFIGPSEVPPPELEGSTGWQAPLDELSAEVLEQQALLQTHYVQAFVWATRQMEDLRRQIADQVQQIADQVQGNDDLRRQIADQVQGNDDLRRQIADQVQDNDDLRRQIADQVQGNDDLRRQIADQAQGNDDLRREVARRIRLPKPLGQFVAKRRGVY